MLKHCKITETRTRRFVGFMLAGAIALLAGGAAAAADETFVVDLSAGTDTRGALFRVDTISGDRSLVSDFGNAAQGPQGTDPVGLAPEASGTVLVIDESAGIGNLGALFRVDRLSGNRSLVSDFGNPAQGPLGRDPFGLALEASGTVLVIDPNAGTGRLGALFRVDAISGNRSLVSDLGDPAQGSLGEDPRGLALEAGGTVLVIDEETGTSESGALFRVDAISGHRSLVSDFGNANTNQGPPGVSPIGLTLEAGGTVLVIDPGAGTGGNAGVLFRVDAASGVRSLVSDFGIAAQGPVGVNPIGLALEASGTVLVTDQTTGTGNNGALFRIDRLSGQREKVSDFGSAGQGTFGADPIGVAVVVPNCFGRVPTLVGDNGNNVLIGSPGADVILGRGGDDLIDGRGGNDRICGGNGNDGLRGGPGNDQVSGGAGDDTLEGGTGNDPLDGGAGTDLIVGGTGTDRCTTGEARLSCEP